MATPPPPPPQNNRVVKVAASFLIPQVGFFGGLINGVIDSVPEVQSNRGFDGNHFMLVYSAIFFEFFFVATFIVHVWRYWRYGVAQWHAPCAKLSLSFVAVIGLLAIALAMASHLPPGYLFVFFKVVCFISLMLVFSPWWAPWFIGDVSGLIFGEEAVVTACSTTAPATDAVTDVAAVDANAAGSTAAVAASSIATDVVTDAVTDAADLVIDVHEHESSHDCITSFSISTATAAVDATVSDVASSLVDVASTRSQTGEDKFVVLVSGLNVGSSSSNPLQLQLFVDHITGHLVDEKEQNSAAQIVQVVVVEDSVEIQNGLLNGQNLGSKDQSMLSEPIKELDIFLTQIAAGIPVDIMPGYNDPANFALPQQPLNIYLFPGSSANTFRSCTNPHLFDVDNVRFLGTSGQNIDDLEKYSEAEDILSFMERTLRWRHQAPTAPNTLESCPDVYFVGNQDKFATRILKGSEGQVVRLIVIPKFSETGVAVMVNLKNLECHTLSFGTQISL